MTKPLFIRVSQINKYFPWSKATAYRDRDAGIYGIYNISGRAMVEIAEIEEAIRSGRKA